MKLTLKDKRVLVLGLGDTGLSVLRWLSRQGAVLSVADTRTAEMPPPGLKTLQAELPQVKVHLGAFDSGAFADAEIIVTSPGVAIGGPLADMQTLSAIRRGTPLVGDVELFAQYRPATAKVIAITGANGKSTVTTLVGEICRAAGLRTVVAGNIGLPVLDTLDAVPEPEVYVLELSSFQLEATSSLHADAATVINISEDHMDRYVGIAEYAAAKARVFAGSGIQVLNRQDGFSMNMALPGRQQITFGVDLPPTVNDFGLKHEDGDIWLMHGSQQLIKTSEMQLAGLHNASNALTALALCHAIGLDCAPLLEALRSYKGLPHRVEWIAEIRGIAFYDDSKGTNVGATVAALQGLPQKVVLIAGGDGKGQDFSPLAAAVAANARAVVLLGRDGPEIGEVLKDSGVPLHQAASLEDAVGKAFKAAQFGDAVLLSPACASFDMFRNYLHRAEVFADAVKALKIAEVAE